MKKNVNLLHALLCVYSALQNHVIWFTGVPEPPKNCRLQNHTSGALELVCSPSYDGGLQQHFMVEGTEVDPHTDGHKTDSVYQKELPGFKMLGSQPVFILRGLLPGKSYQLSVFAMNAKGRSDPPVVIPSVNVEGSTARLTSTGPY